MKKTYPNILVLQSDFGLKDSAVAEMKGIALTVDNNIKIVDNTHLIEPFNTWEAGYRLFQSIKTFPKNTIFVSVVDPGVGTKRKSIVAKTNDDKYIVTPDNGTLTFINQYIGIKEVREINETKHRLKGSKTVYTFYGRDVYAYTGAKLASRKISFEDVGCKINVKKIKCLSYEKPKFENFTLQGIIPVLDIQYGNVWTNINKEIAKNILSKDHKYNILITNETKKISIKNVIYKNTFGNVKICEPILYFNSLNFLSLALNLGNFAKTYDIKSGINWHITISKQK